MITAREPFPEPAPDFSDPLGLLRACHDRIRRQCELLIRLAPKVGQGPVGADVHAAAAAVHRYFSQAAPYHHQDEEQDLFPRLRPDPELRPLLDALAAEHEAQTRAWGLLAPELANPDAVLDRAAFEQAAKAFARGHLLHLETEERLLLPAAEAMLDAGEIKALGIAMARRRGLALRS